MNLKDLAYSLLETQEELDYLRRENAHLKEMLSIYQESQHDQLKANEQIFGSLLCAALDPDSYINKTFGKYSLTNTTFSAIIATCLESSGE